MSAGFRSWLELSGAGVSGRAAAAAGFRSRMALCGVWIDGGVAVAPPPAFVPSAGVRRLPSRLYAHKVAFRLEIEIETFHAAKRAIRRRRVRASRFRLQTADTAESR